MHKCKTWSYLPYLPKGVFGNRGASMFPERKKPALPIRVVCMIFGGYTVLGAIHSWLYEAHPQSFMIAGGIIVGAVLLRRGANSQTAKTVKGNALRYSGPAQSVPLSYLSTSFNDFASK